MMRVLLVVVVVFAVGCARTDVYYPQNGAVAFDGKGNPVGPPSGGRALVLNGSDSLGNTVIDVTASGVRFSSAGGIDNSTSTQEGYRTVRHGWDAGTAAVLGLGLVGSEA
jgi:hypothetical protein